MKIPVDKTTERTLETPATSGRIEREIIPKFATPNNIEIVIHDNQNGI